MCVGVDAVFKPWPVLSSEQTGAASSLNLCAALEATWGHKANMTADVLFSQISIVQSVGSDSLRFK